MSTYNIRLWRTRERYALIILKYPPYCSTDSGITGCQLTAQYSNNAQPGEEKWLQLPVQILADVSDETPGYSCRCKSYKHGREVHQQGEKSHCSKGWYKLLWVHFYLNRLEKWDRCNAAVNVS